MMKRAVKWTSTVDGLEKVRMVDVDLVDQLKKAGLFDVDHPVFLYWSTSTVDGCLFLGRQQAALFIMPFKGVPLKSSNYKLTRLGTRKKATGPPP